MKFSIDVKNLVQIAKETDDLNHYARKNRSLFRKLKEETLFLCNATARQRLWHVENKTKEPPTCKIENCDNNVKWNNQQRSYQTYCSIKCSRKDSEFYQKVKETNLQKYGTEWNIQSKQSQEKRKNTNLQKYGVDNPLKNKDIKNKQKQTNLERYGVEHSLSSNLIRNKQYQTNLERYSSKHAMQNDVIKDKQHRTNIQKYGTKYSIQNKEVKDKQYQTNLKRYNVKNIRQNKDIKNKIQETIREKYGSNREIILEKTKQTNLQKYGTEWNITSDQSKLKRIKTCQLKYNSNSPNQSFDVWSKFIENKNNNNLSQEQIQYVYNTLNNKRNLQTKYDESTITKIAKDLGIAQSTVGLYFKQHDIKITTHPQSQPERDIVQYIQTFYSGEIITNTKNVISPLEIDIFIPEHNLAIEYNGLYYHSELSGKSKNYHLEKTLMCNDKGIQLIHIFENEWNNRKDIVKSRIRNLFNSNDKTYARKCKIDYISKEQKRCFLNENHIQGDVKSSIEIGLYYNNGLVAVMTFGKPRYNRKYDYELLRFACIKYCNIVGGASKMLKFFIKKHQPSSIISYCDLRWGNGNVYHKLGFQLDYLSSPNYFYFKKNKNNQLFSRVKFQKHKLGKQLEIFDPNLTEWQNMQLNDYDWIWDCGNSVWCWSGG